MEKQQARRRFTREFKLESVRQVISEGRTQKQVAEELGLNTNVLGPWVKEFRADAEQVFPGSGSGTGPETRSDSPFGSRQPVRHLRIPSLPGASSSHPEYEPEGRLLGQRPDGELFQHSEAGMCAPPALLEPPGGHRGLERLHRPLLQPNQTSFTAG
jgi:transposase-like protein